MYGNAENNFSDIKTICCPVCKKDETRIISFFICSFCGIKVCRECLTLLEVKQQFLYLCNLCSTKAFLMRSSLSDETLSSVEKELQIVIVKKRKSLGYLPDYDRCPECNVFAHRNYSSRSGLFLEVHRNDRNKTCKNTGLRVGLDTQRTILGLRNFRKQ